MAPSVRMPDDVVADVDEHLIWLSSQSPGKVTRADAFRDLVKRGLTSVQPPEPASDPDRYVIRTTPFLPREDPWLPVEELNDLFKKERPRVPMHTIILLKPGELMRLTAQAHVASGHVIGLSYHPLHGPRDDAPRISDFTIGGGSDLLPYVGEHPLSAWSHQTHHTMPGYPKLRDAPLLVAPNISDVTIISPKDAPVFAFLLSLVMLPKSPSSAGTRHELQGMPYGIPYRVG